MNTNLKIDDSLLSEALKLGKFKTKKETVNEALKTFISHKKQLLVLNYEGVFTDLDNFDYKKFRK